MTILETQRLTLRRLTLSDTPFIIELLNSPGWLKYIGDRNVRNDEQAKSYLLNGPIKSYNENGFGLGLVELKDSRTPIGMCGLLKRDYLENPDIGFAFLPDSTGKGFAFEIAQATLNHAKEVLNISSVMAITLPDNISSIRLLEKIGLRFMKHILSQDGTEELMLFSN